MYHHDYNQVLRIKELVMGAEDTKINQTIQEEQKRDAAYQKRNCPWCGRTNCPNYHKG